MAESESCIKKMKVELIELEKTRYHMEVLQEDAKINREHCKELTKSNAKLQKALHKSNKNNEKLKVENAKLRDEEKRRMSLLRHNCDPVSSGNSIAWKSPADSSGSISPLWAYGNFATRMEPGITTAKDGKGAVARERKHEVQKPEMISKNCGCTTTNESRNNKAQETVQNIDNVEYLDCKGDDTIPANWYSGEPYNLDRYPTSSGAQWTEQYSKAGANEIGQFHESENERKIRGMCMFMKQLTA